MEIRSLILLGFISAICTAVEVIEPRNLAGTFVTVRFNHFIGSQADDYNIHNASVVGFRSLKSALVLTDTDCENVQGKVVLFTSGETIFNLIDEYRMHTFIENCGGIAVLRILQPAYGPRSFLGFHAADRDPDCCKGRTEVTIPVVSVWYEDFDPVLDLVMAGGEARVSLTTLDVDVWDTQYRHNSVLHALLRWVLTGMTVVVICITVVASYYHRILSQARRRESKCFDDIDLSIVMRITSKFSLVQSVLFCELCQCVIRIPYFVLGPGLITSELTWEQFSYLSSISGPFQIMSIVLSIFMYHKIGAMRWQQKHSPRVYVTAFFVVIMFFVTEIALGHVRAMRFDAAEVLRLYLLWISITISVASFVFWVYGILFLRKLHLSHRRVSDAATKLTSREQARRRLTIWIMFGGTTRLVMVAAVFAPALFPLKVYVPYGIGISFFVNYLMATLTSFGQVMAFFPQRIGERRNSTNSIKDRFSIRDPQRDSIRPEPRRDSVNRDAQSSPVVLMP